MKHNRPFYGKKVSVIIPCKNRERSLLFSLPTWFTQIYQPAQVVLIDYSSNSCLYSMVRKLCERYRKTISFNEPMSNSDCSVFRVENQPFFNMSHALNYGIARSQSDIVAIAGTESVSTPYYLDIAMNIIDESTFTRCIRGRLVMPRHMILDINGYPELMEYWGGEDDVVVHQLFKRGYSFYDLDYSLVGNIQNHGFSDPIEEYADESQCLQKHIPNQYNHIPVKNSGVISKIQGSILNMKRFSMYCKKNDPLVNNYNKPFGNGSPILLSKQDEKDPVANVEISRTPQKSYTGKKVSVVIPVMDREDNLRATLPMWLSQLYVNKQIVVVDYSSTNPVENIISSICENYRMTYSVNEYKDDVDIILFRIDNMKYFNISHAYNYAISRIKTDVIATVCADSCAHDYYLDLVMNAVDDESLIQIWWGLHTITYDNWKKLNGHQEFITGWGAEDDDFRMRSQLMGLKIKILPSHFVYNIPHSERDRIVNRPIKDFRESANLNQLRFMHYRSIYGGVGNYGSVIGGDNPVGYGGDQVNLIPLACCVYNTCSSLPDFVVKDETLGVHYVIMNSSDKFCWKEYEQWIKFGDVKYNTFFNMISENEIAACLSRTLKEYELKKNETE